MQAIRIHQYGAVSVIRTDDVPRPSPGPDEVLVRVAGTSFNPSEIALRRGLLRSVLPVDLPYTLGGELAGTVVEVGAQVDTLAVGDRVLGRIDTGGGAAELATAAAELLVAAPTSIPLAHAAAIPIAGVTAWQAVFEHASVTRGQRVLINGAGGGVGGYAVQLCRHTGAHVTATASPRSTDVVREQGADQIIDYTRTTLAEALDEPVDAVINLVAMPPDELRELTTLVHPGGIVVSATVPVPAPPGSRVVTRHFVARNDTSHLTELVRLVDSGVVRVDIAASRPLTDLAEVHREAEAGAARGKIVLLP